VTVIEAVLNVFYTASIDDVVVVTGVAELQ
jgi:hypothetical protein